VKNRFGFAFQPGLNEIVYRRPRQITNGPRLTPVLVKPAPTSPHPGASPAKPDRYGAGS
jgi:hypothetical protein